MIHIKIITTSLIMFFITHGLLYPSFALPKYLERKTKLRYSTIIDINMFIWLTPAIIDGFYLFWTI